MDVRRAERSDRDQSIPDCFDAALLDEEIATRSADDRIEDVDLRLERLHELGDGEDDLGASQHSTLHRADRSGEIIEDRAHLSFDQSGRDELESLDPLRVLGGDRRDGGHTEGPECSRRLQIRLNPGSGR